ncbi:MAG: hypothetical protein K6G10_11820 [Butyrivibrio sp.]|nr:hypothetical protein [Butyrivibrio sp.]
MANNCELTKEGLNAEVCSDSIALEQVLASIGALAAVSSIRKRNPDSQQFFTRFDQHHDNDMDFPMLLRY